MKIHREGSPELLSTLREALTVAKLAESAVDCQPRNARYNKKASLRLLALSSPTLFDKGANFVRESVASSLEKTLSEKDVLNSSGIFLEFDFLFLYPYSPEGLSLIAAETSRSRSSIQDPQFEHGLSLEHLSQEDVLSSALVRSQVSSLELLLHWISAYKLDESEGARVNIRFTLESLGLETIIINDTIFCAQQLLSKRNRYSARLETMGLVLEVSSASDRDTFIKLEDNFRFLWKKETALDFLDAVRLTPGALAPLPPSEVRYEAKKSRILRESIEIDPLDIGAWSSRVLRKFRGQCRDVTPQSAVDNLMIATSWAKDESGAISPRLDAKELSAFLDRDFSQDKAAALLSIVMLNATPGRYLSNQIYHALDSTTLAIVLLSGDATDVDGLRVCPPNIAFELGYLMSHIGQERVLILREQRTQIPSNIQDVVRVDYKRGEIVLAYTRVLSWLFQTLQVPEIICAEIVERHRERLRNEVLSGSLEAEKGEAALERISEPRRFATLALRGRVDPREARDAARKVASKRKLNTN
ncbi:MAG: nucleotide-binding protein [bacterium]|nr:nucleotide-binding protein [bacterium]